MAPTAMKAEATSIDAALENNIARNLGADLEGGDCRCRRDDEIEFGQKLIHSGSEGRSTQMCGGQGGRQNRRAGLSKCDKSGVTQMCKICRHCREAVGGSRIPMNTKRFTQIFAGQLNWVDTGAKILQQPDRLCDGGGHFRIDGSIWRLGPQSDLRAFEDALSQHERRQLAARAARSAVPEYLAHARRGADQSAAGVLPAGHRRWPSRYRRRGGY
jgi:hypothetical protein